MPKGTYTPERPAPELDPLTEPFWTGGERGELLIQRCSACGRWSHPPVKLCPRCHERDLAFEPVSGQATVRSFTVSRKAWSAGIEPPYVLAEVELPEQPGLRVLTALVGVDPDGRDVRIGMAVGVHFEAAGDAWVPVFRP